MSGSSESYHEPVEELSGETRDMHRALVSLQEELEAVDWYRQRMTACGDAELKAILAHNMREEMEHAAMVLEWLRRHDGDLDGHLREYLFTEAPITELEGDEDAGDESAEAPQETVAETARSTIGSLK